MAKRKLLPGIYANFDDEGITVFCDGEPIEDMEFSWDDLNDSELLQEAAEEIVEYLDEDEAADIDNPVGKTLRVLKKLCDEHRVTSKSDNSENSDFEEGVEEDDTDVDDDDDDDSDED